MVGPEQQVGAVVWFQSRNSKSSQPSRETPMVQSSVNIHDVHLWRVAVLHQPRHSQKVLFYTLPQTAHLHRYSTSTINMSPHTAVVNMGSQGSFCGLTILFRGEDSPSVPLWSSSVAFISLASTMFCNRML